ncbi:kelch repeat and BTB domain protein [Fusarium beomiforme]|uniref:Kelch repeat and BTB domain protein n=1 Tax=Fusarium beomiforme TaxID=44412 RepID=A0A9P5APD7_9HYPO|nr:kelch repeat and BTB domain protein [Fusarium beomiforme]
MGEPMDFRQEGSVPPPLFGATHRCKEYMQDLSEMLQTGLFSDFTIICGNNRYKVHEAILSTQSKFFKAICTGGYKESDGEINLPEDDLAAVQEMNGYFYNVEYPLHAKPIWHYEDDVEAEFSDTEYDAEARYRMRLFGAEFVGQKRIRQLGELYALGEKYGIQGPKEAAKCKLESDLHRGGVGADDCAEAAEEVYTSTIQEDRGLRDSIVKMIGRDILLLGHVAVQEVMRATDLAVDVLLYMLQEMRTQARFRATEKSNGLRTWGSCPR